MLLPPSSTQAMFKKIASSLLR